VRVPIIPNVAQLHGLIAEKLLLKNGLLTGQEIRFLRKNAGLSGKDFARYIEVHPAHLSRVENGKGRDRLGAAPDKLACAIIAMYSCALMIREVLRGVHDPIKENRALFELQGDHWAKANMP
jgi:transcriptional regulator with XRE-family HTH domain